MADAARIFLLAGEASGDRIGAELIKHLRVVRAVTPLGVGGPELEGEGLKSLFPMSDLSVMGFADVLARLPLLLWRARQTSRAILELKPDLVILIDSQVFSATVAKQVRKAGYTGKMLLYVAPSVWAWKPERAPALRPLFDEVLAVLPFEPAAMQRLGGPPTSYVGHPALEHTTLRRTQPTKGPLLLLPGSRTGEIRRHLPIMRAVANALRDHPRVSGFVLPTTGTQEARVVEAISAWETPVFVTSAANAKRQAFADAVGAVAVSGTITLELALSGVPMVVVYVADGGQIRRWKAVGSPPISLPNILARSNLVPEVVGGEAQPEAAVSDIEMLIGNPTLLAHQQAGFAAIRAEMEKGAPEAPLVDPVQRVLANLP